MGRTYSLDRVGPSRYIWVSSIHSVNSHNNTQVGTHIVGPLVSSCCYSRGIYSARGEVIDITLSNMDESPISSWKVSKSAPF